MEHGLSEKEVAEHGKLGTNKLSLKQSSSSLKLFLAQFPNAINGILALATLFSLFLHNLIDAAFIFAVIVVNSIFSFIQEYKAEKALEKLTQLTKPFCKVIRDGHVQQIAAEDVVIGDIILLEDGDRIPADGKITSTTYLEVDESILTGESLPVIKNMHDTLLRGTFIIKGKAHIQVTAVGLQTRFGEIAKTLSQIDNEATPLQKDISSTTKLLSLFAALLSLLLIPIGAIEGKSIIFMTFLAISIAVAAIPESLPGIVTVALAIGASKMAKKKAIIRKMAAIETLGAMQVVLLDKTGTLTTNNMEVKETWLPDERHKKIFLDACVIGNTASVKKHGEVVGDKTDGALITWAVKEGISPEDLLLSGKILDEYTFDPITKTISTVWEQNKKTFMFVKGAPEEIFKRSLLSKAHYKQAEDQFHTMAENGLRVIALAYKEDHFEKGMKRKVIESHLTFLGLLGLYDAPRPEAEKAILDAKKAGIQPIMVTGDNEITALAIAKAIGLAGENEQVVTGEELSTMSDAQLEAKAHSVHVYARTRPEDKLRLTQMYKRLGFIVGVTGDGVNDSLALKQANVGVAMGEKGTDVAIEASDMIVTDDNFSTLIGAVKEGRRIYSNLQRSITYLLASNFSELLLITMATVFDAPSPLLPTQILWMNLVTDVFPAFSLVVDGAHVEDFKKNSPTALISPSRWIVIAVIGVTIAASVFAMFVALTASMPLVRARTITFNIFIACHLLFSFLIRGKHALTQNKLLWLTILVTVIAQAAITCIPFFQNIFALGW